MENTMPDPSPVFDPHTVEAQVLVHDVLGLHARPAGRITTAARNFSCSISLVLEEYEADAKSILDILTLAVPSGTLLTVRCQGEDAAEACAALFHLFATGSSESAEAGDDRG